MKSVLPEIPTANLNTANQATFHNVLASMGTYNAVIDTAYANADAAFNEVLRDHGIVGWYWTFSYFGEGTKRGYVGQTNNKANVAKGEAMYDIGLAPEYKNTSVEVGDIVDVLFVTYDGVEKVVPCEVFAVEKYKDRYEVICRGETWGTEIYTRKLVIKKNNLGCTIGVGLLIVFVLLAVAILYKVCSLKKSIKHN
jgi:hypothetical protein